LLRGQKAVGHLGLTRTRPQAIHPVRATRRLCRPMQVSGVEPVDLQTPVLRRVPEAGGHLLACAPGLEERQPAGQALRVGVAVQHVTIERSDERDGGILLPWLDVAEVDGVGRLPPEYDRAAVRRAGADRP